MYDKILKALKAAYFIRGFLYNETNLHFRDSKYINCIIDVLEELYNDCLLHEYIKNDNEIIEEVTNIV